ncbi:MAG: V-type ATP synthase subunit E [Candidatus Latescibacteria bacterium]|nr:V-type ATP synthase subunit E [Candidatus Latescibacterota bacterium]
MEKSELLTAVSETAGRECQKTVADARALAGTIIGKANAVADEMRAGVRGKVQAEAVLIRERKFNAARFRFNAERYRVKALAIETLWRDAEKLITESERSGDYPRILESLFTECLDRAPDGACVVVSPADSGIIAGCIARSGGRFDLREDSAVHGGVEFHWPDGKTVLKNTLGARLDRLKAGGNADITEILFGPGKDANE